MASLASAFARFLDEVRDTGVAERQGQQLVSELVAYGLDDPLHLLEAVNEEPEAILVDIFGATKVNTAVKEGFGKIVAGAARSAKVVARSKYPYRFAPLADALVVAKRPRQPVAEDASDRDAGAGAPKKHQTAFQLRRQRMGHGTTSLGGREARLYEKWSARFQAILRDAKKKTFLG